MVEFNVLKFSFVNCINGRVDYGKKNGFEIFFDFVDEVVLVVFYFIYVSKYGYVRSKDNVMCMVI